MESSPSLHSLNVSSSFNGYFFPFLDRLTLGWENHQLVMAMP